MRGIASSLAAARLPLVAIVACDMPFVSPELIGALAGHVEAEALDVCVPREERGIEPLCAVWRRDACAPVAHELLACDRQRIRCLINRVQAGYMDEPQIVKAAARRSASRTSIRPRSLRRPSCSPRRLELPCLTIFVPTRENLALAMGPSLAPAAAAAVDIRPRKRQRRLRIASRTARPRSAMPLITNAKSSCRSIATSM